MNKVGSLYQVKRYYWLVFPSKETALAARRHGSSIPVTSSTATAPPDAAYWSKRFNCTVSSVSPGEIIVFLEKDGRFNKVLSTDGTLGWIWCEDWLLNDSFEEVTAE